MRCKKHDGGGAGEQGRNSSLILFYIIKLCDFLNSTMQDYWYISFNKAGKQEKVLTDDGINDKNQTGFKN